MQLEKRRDESVEKVFRRFPDQSDASMADSW